MAINGKQYDHEDNQIMLPSGLAFGIQELNYEDGQEVEARYGRGAVPRGWANIATSAFTTPTPTALT